jgi:hypothetical protein
MRQTAKVTFLYRSSNEPAHPTQNNISGDFPSAAHSAIVLMFILNLVLQWQLSSIPTKGKNYPHGFLGSRRLNSRRRAFRGFRANGTPAFAGPL